MALGAMDAYEKLGITDSNYPVFFGIDGTDEGLEAVRQSKLATTVYNDKGRTGICNGPACICSCYRIWHEQYRI